MLIFQCKAVMILWCEMQLFRGAHATPSAGTIPILGEADGL